MNAWSIRAFTPAFDGLWRCAPLTTLHLLFDDAQSECAHGHAAVMEAFTFGLPAPPSVEPGDRA